MADQGGPEAATKLREAGFANLIVGLTGDAMEEDVAVFEAAGADIVISKPMKPGVLDMLLAYCEKFGAVSPVLSHGAAGRRKLKSFVLIH